MLSLLAAVAETLNKALWELAQRDLSLEHMPSESEKRVLEELLDLEEDLVEIDSLLERMNR